MRMLVVDDEEGLRSSLVHQFTEEGFEVEMAEDGDIALAMMERAKYDIILLDLKMPRMDGMTVLREMKKLHKSPHVIVLTIVDDLSKAQESVKLGADDFITKPYDPEELLHIVIKMLSS